jgi:predicted amidohydrolase
MKNNILIAGGHVIDPARGINMVGDVFISGDRIVEIGADLPQPDLVVNAKGCLVLPGLIDFHTHVYFGGTDNSIPCDVSMLPNGVTTVVDAGTAGTANYENFYKSVIANSMVRIKSFLCVSPTGQVTMKYDENYSPQYYDEEKLELLFKKYPNDLLGLKLRQSKEVVGELGLKPLEGALRIAEQLSCRIAVHTTDSPGCTNELVQMFRPGDIFSHAYHGKGSTIIGDDNCVLLAVKAARNRGVIFDAANGKNHFAFKTAEAALEDGFAPDIISTDLSVTTMFKQPVLGLPWLMSKYLALGLDLYDVVAACTSTPARLMGMEDEIGILAPGACADVAILKLVEHRCEFWDCFSERRIGQKLLLPQATIRAGNVVFRQMNF